MTKELFQKYTEGRCNQQEKREAEEWLRTCNEDELNELMLQVWNDPQNQALPVEQTQEMWKKIAASVVDQQPEGRVIRLFARRKWAVAITATGIFVSAMLLTFQKKQETPVLVQKTHAQPVADTAIIDWAHVANSTAKEKLVVLEDGSEVTIFPASAITYRSRFGADRRDIFLEGKAVFKVEKDSDRPFTVYSDDIATTALGTKFMVDAGAGSSYIRVYLYEGKIVVKSGKNGLNGWAKQECLLPGDVLNYDISKGIAAVKHHKSINSNTVRLYKSQELVFSNEELTLVFERMKKEYHIDIIYSKADIAGMYFTGSISKTSSLSGVLRVITQMNGLNLKEEDGKYIIRKTE